MQEHAQDKTIRTQVDEMGKKMDTVLFLLRGNELDKEDNGLVGDIKDLIKRVTKLETLKLRLIYFLVGLSVPAGWGTTQILASIGKVLLHLPPVK